MGRAREPASARVAAFCCCYMLLLLCAHIDKAKRPKEEIRDAVSDESPTERDPNAQIRRARTEKKSLAIAIFSKSTWQAGT